MNRLFNRNSFVLLAVVAVFVGATVFTTSPLSSNNVKAQAGFSNASLQGTYWYDFFYYDSADPAYDAAVTGYAYFDGTGSITGNQLGNFPGEPDENGNPTRRINDRRDAAFPAEYVVNPNGYFTYVGGGGVFEFDGVITGLEVIDGVPVATGYVLYNRNTGARGGLGRFVANRISDLDLVTPPPDGQ